MVAVAWLDDRSDRDGVGYSDVYYNYRDADGAFRVDGDLRVDSMYDGLSAKSDLNFAVVGGRWIAAWTDGRAGTTDVYAASMPIGDEADPPELDR